MSNDRLTKQIFLWDHSICRKNWSSELSQILQSLNLPNTFAERRECDMGNVTQCYHRLSNAEWLTNLLHTPKLRNYRLIKESLECEPYVAVNLDRTDRSFLAQYNIIGILPIAVETGRHFLDYNRPRAVQRCHWDYWLRGHWPERPGRRTVAMGA